MPQAWLDGAQSIADLRFNNGQDRLPLWALAYWKAVSKTIQKQNDWKQSIHWLTEESKCDASLPRIDVENLLASLAWTSPTRRNSDEGTHVFAQLLGNRGLCGTIMDAMTCHLQERLQKITALASEVTILPASFWQVFVKAARRNQYNNEDLPSSLKRLEGRVRDGLKQAYMGVFVGGNHEIAVCIDFEHENIKYGQYHQIVRTTLPTESPAGDSLAGEYPAPTAFLNDVQKWTNARFSKKFRVMGDALVHGRQLDGFSCLVCAANTIVHAVFRDPVWTATERTKHQMAWFITLVRDECEMVSLLYVWCMDCSQGIRSSPILCIPMVWSKT